MSTPHPNSSSTPQDEPDFIPSNLDFIHQMVQVLAQAHHKRMGVQNVNTDTFWKLFALYSFLHLVLNLGFFCYYRYLY